MRVQFVLFGLFWFVHQGFSLAVVSPSPMMWSLSVCLLHLCRLLATSNVAILLSRWLRTLSGLMTVLKGLTASCAYPWVISDLLGSSSLDQRAYRLVCEPSRLFLTKSPARCYPSPKDPSACLSLSRRSRAESLAAVLPTLVDGV